METNINLEFRLQEESPTDWNQNLLKSDLGNIFNTPEYAQYAKSRLGWKPLFLSMINSNGNIVSQTILFEIQRKKLGKFSRLTKLVFNKLKIRWIYGPVILLEQNPMIVNSFLKYLANNYKKLDGTTHPLLGTEFRMPSLQFQKWSTFIIDLRQPRESILANMDKKSVRKNIERAEERGVKVFEITDSTIIDYHKILNQHRLENGNKEYDLEDTVELWKLLKPIGFGGYLAKKDNEIIGGITFSFFNKYINEWGIARTKLDATEKLYSQDLLKWKIIEWGMVNKQKFYDFSGVNPNPQSMKEVGILRYKRKWGGIQREYLIIQR
ncbi:hypothetical protein [Candidatus Nitrosotenuis uzonensis]|uniref:BioF2-like acetyltransferase domain-containing protein n=1 Tax=Candidatus Nitrosotenuis uzonensis TaxID=1407055 RepID=V6AVD9_9ARCH|nr:hypothetical protein [Candidatus Nitrosotenuis uzonensis]CDI06468.1 hypothetical protein NITUZ_50015 [Candidatus Nitrosotenuis uzonensis]